MFQCIELLKFVTIRRADFLIILARNYIRYWIFTKSRISEIFQTLGKLMFFNIPLSRIPAEVNFDLARWICIQNLLVDLILAVDLIHYCSLVCDYLSADLISIIFTSLTYFTSCLIFYYSIWVWESVSH